LVIFDWNNQRFFKFSAGKKPPSFNKVGGGAGFGIEPYKCRIEKRE
jgi:hypothetical protein